MDNRAYLKRKKILDTALKCFIRDGYSNSTFKNIAVQAGISRASLYLYFKNKKDLFINMTNEMHHDYYMKSEEILRSAKPDKEKIRNIVDIWIIEPYRIISETRHPNDWLDKLVQISEQSEMKYRELFLKSIAPLTGYDSAEVIVLSIKGLLDDRPPVSVLQKRIEILIDRFC